MQAIVYTRISKDREGAGLGVDRQLADCQALAASFGWDIVAVFSDNDISAYSGKHRPGYQAMCEALEAGTAQAVLAWHTDRLHRRPIELESFIDLADRKGIDVRTVKSGDLDLSTSSGKMVARMLGAAARHEVEHMIERTKSAKRQAALDGKFRGARRPFGYEKDGVTARPEEAEAIRSAAEAVLSGVALRQVARDWNAAGLRTSFGGNEFSATEVRKILLRERNAGISLVQDDNGATVHALGQWDVILDADTFTALQGTLRDPERRTSTGTERVHQGTGVYRCGKCGATMRATAHNKTAGAWTRAYTCSVSKHLGRDAEALDTLVDSVVIGRLSMPDAALVLGAPVANDVASLHTERDNLRSRLDALSIMFGALEIDAAQLKKGSAEIKRRLDTVEAKLAVARAACAVANVVLAGDDLRATWETSSAEVRSKVISALMTVTVLPGARGRRPGGAYFDPSLVQIDWKG